MGLYPHWTRQNHWAQSHLYVNCNVLFKAVIINNNEKFNSHWQENTYLLYVWAIQCYYLMQHTYMYSSSILVLLMYVQGNQRVTVAIFRANFSFLVKVKFNPVHFHMIAYIPVVFHFVHFLLPVKTM